MEKDAIERFVALAKQPQVYEKTVAYVREHLAQFLRSNERVLLCFPEEGQYSLAALMKRAVGAIGAEVVLWGPERSWQSLLRQAFFGRVGVIVGTPLVMLGLSKVARETGTPLKVRNVVLTGEPCEDWMVEGIQNGFDARIWRCYEPIPGLVVGGFSCQKRTGVHIRAEVLTARTVDRNGTDAPEGEIVLSSIEDPSLCLRTGQRGRLLTQRCACGNEAVSLTAFSSLEEQDPALYDLREYLLSWSSVLDYRAVRTEMGLELEVVAFPGQRLPKLPSCAKLTVRPWIPKHDVPFCLK